eukprot:418945_1
MDSQHDNDMNLNSIKMNGNEAILTGWRETIISIIYIILFYVEKLTLCTPNYVDQEEYMSHIASSISRKCEDRFYDHSNKIFNGILNKKCPPKLDKIANMIL